MFMGHAAWWKINDDDDDHDDDENPICGTHRQKESVGSGRVDRDDRRQKS